jgi:hypothetical protein
MLLGEEHLPGGAFLVLTRRCNVHNWPSWNHPGDPRWRYSNGVFAFSPGVPSGIPHSYGQTASKGANFVDGELKEAA